MEKAPPWRGLRERGAERRLARRSARRAAPSTATAGFRVYRADALRGIVLDDVESQGYCFQVDMVWRVLRAGGVVVEVPITFVERDLGASKMSNAIIREALVKVTQWGLAHRATQLAGIVRRR